MMMPKGCGEWVILVDKISHDCNGMHPFVAIRTDEPQVEYPLKAWRSVVPTRGFQKLNHFEWNLNLKPFVPVAFIADGFLQVDEEGRGIFS